MELKRELRLCCSEPSTSEFQCRAIIKGLQNAIDVCLRKQTSTEIHAGIRSHF